MEHQTNSFGRTLLRITDPVMILFGIFGILAYGAALALLLGVHFLTDAVFHGASDIIGLSLLLGASILELISGILGRKAARQPQKAGRCLVWGSLALLLSLAGLIHILLRDAVPMYWLSLPLTVLTPVLYLIGAARAKQGR